MNSQSSDSTPDETTTQAQIDRTAGAGALSRESAWAENANEDYEYANDGRSNTRTTFYWTPDNQTPNVLRDRDRHQLHRDPDDRRSWKTLSQWNDGVGESSRRQDNFDADVSRWAQTFCSQLGLPQYERSRVEYVAERIDMSTFGSITAEAIILGIISLVVDDEIDADPDEWTPDDWIIYQDEFESLMDDVEMDRKTLWTVRRRVHHETDFISGSSEE